MSDLNPHRPAWVSWLPAVVLTVLIAAAVFVAIVIVPPLALGPPPAEPGQVDDRNFSVFTEEGLEFIDADRVPRLDLRDSPVEAGPLGLDDEGVLTVGPHPLGLDYALVLLVTGDDPQGARFLAERFSLTTEGGALTRIDVVPSATTQASGAFRQSAAYVAEQGARYGFTAPTNAEVLDLVLAAQQSGVAETITTAFGTDAGLPIAAQLTCVGEGFCGVTFIVTPPVG